jgi:hypothetical protein
VTQTYYIVEASHLFRAGDKHHQQIFVLDVVDWLQSRYFPGTEAKTTVLHGSVKDEQAARYAAALERHGATVIRMKPIASTAGADKWFFKPTWYCHKMMGTDIPKKSEVVMVGFHNPRYKAFLEKYAGDFSISLAAFATPSKKQGLMDIPDDFAPFLKNVIHLDDHVSEIKAQFKVKASSNP